MGKAMGPMGSQSSYSKHLESQPKHLAQIDPGCKLSHEAKNLAFSGSPKPSFLRIIPFYDEDVFILLLSHWLKGNGDVNIHRHACSPSTSCCIQPSSRTLQRSTYQQARDT